MYGTGMAFYKVEHSSLLEALRIICPEVEIPSRKQLASSLLDDAYTKSIKLMTAMLSGKVTTPVTDAWTDIRGQSVINYMAVSRGETFFLESVNTGVASHDVAFVAADIERVILKYNFMELGVVVTDNVAVNKAAWETLQQTFPHVFFHGCVCHALHLFVKDILTKFKWLNGLRDGCKLLVTFFKKNNKL